MFFLLEITHFELGIVSTRQLQVIALFVFAILSWVTQVVHNSYTAISVIILVALLKLDSLENVLSYTFGNTMFLLMFGVLMISYAFKHSGLANYIGERVVGYFGDSSRKILFSLMFLSYFLGSFLTAIAGVSISLSIALQVIESNGLEKGSRLGKAYMLGITYGGLIGGMATPLGTPVNLMMVQYLYDFGQFKLTFFHWILVGVPLSLLVLFTCYLVMVLLYHVEKIPLARNGRSASLKLTEDQKKSTKGFVVVLALFIISQGVGDKIPFFDLDLTIIAAIGAMLIAVPYFRASDWKESIKNMDWESLVFLAGSISLGYLLYNTETADVIAGAFFQSAGGVNEYLLVFILAFFATVMHLILASNTVTGTVIVPILISFAKQAGISPWFVTAPAMFCVSLAFLLPTESPTNILTYNTGYFTMKDMLKAGSIMTVLGILEIGFFLIFYGALTNLY